MWRERKRLKAATRMEAQASVLTPIIVVLLFEGEGYSYMEDVDVIIVVVENCKKWWCDDGFGNVRLH